MINFHSLLKPMGEKKFSQLINFLVHCYHSEKHNQNYEFSIKCIHSILLCTIYILWNLYVTWISGRFPETFVLCFLWFKIITAVILRLKSWPVLHESWVPGCHGAWILCCGIYYVCVVSMKLALCQPSGTNNFLKICIPVVLTEGCWYHCGKKMEAECFPRMGVASWTDYSMVSQPTRQ